MLGFAMDARQRHLVDIGLTGPDRGAGGKYLFLPPGYTGDTPPGHFVIASPTYIVSFGVRGFKVDGKNRPSRWTHEANPGVSLVESE